MLCADIAWDSISHDQNDSAPHARRGHGENSCLGRRV